MWFMPSMLFKCGRTLPSVYAIAMGHVFINSNAPLLPRRSFNPPFLTMTMIWKVFRMSYPPCFLSPLANADTATDLQDYQDSQQAFQFLMGLNESYNAKRGQIFLMQPLPSINKFYSLLLREEAQLQVSSADPPNRSQPAAFSCCMTKSHIKIVRDPREILLLV